MIYNGYIEVIADRVGDDTTFAKIIEMVEEAQESKTTTQKFLDRFAQIYTPAIVILSILVYLISGNAEIALTFLVIACPGALVISAPVSMVAGIGKEQLVRILRPGDFAGENLFSSAAQDSYAEVTQASEICTIYQADMQELLRQYPDISLHILAELCRRLDLSEKQTATIATASINARLDDYLVEQAELMNSDTYELPMSRRDLASYLGTTPETVSRRLGEFEEAAWIVQTGQRQIKILDLDVLLLVQ